MIRRVLRRLRRDRERGATLVMFVAALSILVGAAAFAVDLGWIYFQGVRVQRAAEAAALAGVVHMPLPSGELFATSDAVDAAVDIAEKNGYAPAQVTAEEVPSHPNRLRIEVDDTVDTFFMRLFGIETIDLSRHATAEQLPPLKIGSDEPLLGNDPALPSSARSNFWLAINGDRSVKRNGDAHSTHCTSSAGCSGTPNTEYRNPAYYYAVEVGGSEVGNLLSIDVYDPGFLSGNDVTGDANWGSPTMSGADLVFTVYAPDSTPSDWKDNSVIPAGCGPHTFGGESSTSAPTIQDWVTICQDAAIEGIYVVKVDINGGNGNNSFTLRGITAGGYGSDVAVYGLGAMSIWSNEEDTSAVFKVARVDEIYAGNPLVVSAFDLGDVTLPSGQSAVLEFLGEAAGFECEYRVRWEDGSIQNDWAPDDSPGGAPCSLITSSASEPRKYNNKWVDFRFTIPSDYSCGDPANPCWWMVDYNFPAGSNVTERTTWHATIAGAPIHLIYDPNP